MPAPLPLLEYRLGLEYGRTPWEVRQWPAQDFYHLLWLRNEIITLEKVFPLEQE